MFILESSAVNCRKCWIFFLFILSKRLFVTIVKNIKAFIISPHQVIRLFSLLSTGRIFFLIFRFHVVLGHCIIVKDFMLFSHINRYWLCCLELVMKCCICSFLSCLFKIANLVYWGDLTICCWFRLQNMCVECCWW